jgi:PAS domain-containing protein
MGRGMKKKSDHSLLYAIVGFLLGAAFSAIGIGVWYYSLRYAGIITGPTFPMVGLILAIGSPLPVALGFSGWLIGRRQDQLEKLNAQLGTANNQLEKREQEMLIENSERLRLEKVLERGKREWEGIFDAVQDSIIVTDSEGIVIRCNRSAIGEFGTSFDQFVNTPIERTPLGEADNIFLRPTGRQRWIAGMNYRIIHFIWLMTALVRSIP